MSEFNFLVDFWRTTDENGSMTWVVYVTATALEPTTT